MISGIGIHSGVNCTVRLHRSDGPLRFRRGRQEIMADLGSIASSDRCVVLGSGGARVATVEHLLAALSCSGFWSGVVVEASADELPVLDGSALPWLAEVGKLDEAPAPPAPLEPAAAVRVAAERSIAELLPGGPLLDVAVDYPHRAIGCQSWIGGPERWRELLPARTFGFLEELESLKAAGLAAGANVENAIVFDDNGPLGPLRFSDEPVRHKALDLLGDLALLGRPLNAIVRVTRGSHRLHVNLMRSLLQDQPQPGAMA